MLSDRNTDLLFVLLRAGLHPEASLPGDLAGASGAAWQRIYSVAVRQGVAAVAWDGLERLLEAGAIRADGLPPRQVKLQWALHARQTEESFARQERVIGELAAFYGGHGMKMLLLKGYGLARCYPRPAHRPCGDVDIWLYGRQQQADELLHRQRGLKIDRDKHHHTVFYLDGVMVENHYDFLNVHSHASNRRLDGVLRRLAEQAGETLGIGEGRVMFPSPDFDALFLLRHAAVHFAAIGIVLRHVADWAMFAAHHRGRIDWQRLLTVARAENMLRFLDCLCALAVDCLGADPADFPPLKRDAALERRVLREILNPEFPHRAPCTGALRVVWFKMRRWWAGRWKHRIVYREGLLQGFVRSSWSHLLKPRSIAH